MRKNQRSQFFQFLFVGGIAASINFISRIALNEFMSYRMSIILAYIVGMIVAFLLFKHFVFEKSGKPYIEEVKNFTLVNIFSIIQVWFISVGFVEYLFPYLNFNFYPKEIAHLVGLGVPVISSYFGHKYFSFRKV